MAFLLCIDIRHQDEGWAPVTYVTINRKQYELTSDFAFVMESEVIETSRTTGLRPPLTSTNTLSDIKPVMPTC
jgi:hypothetical protein